MVIITIVEDVIVALVLVTSSVVVMRDLLLALCDSDAGCHGNSAAVSIDLVWV